MTTMGPPHKEHRQSGIDGILLCGIAAGSDAGGMAESTCLQTGNSVPRRRLARKPKCRMRTNPRGSTCSRNRRKNSSAGSVKSRFLFL